MENNTLEQSDRNTEVSFSREEQLELGIIDHDGELTSLGLLLSEECAHTIKVSVFKGADREQFSESRCFNGALFKQINEVIDFLNGDKRLKEALVSALVQRDYSYPGELIVNRFSDRVEFIAMGAIDEGFSRWRNEKLLAVLRRLRFSANKNMEFTSTVGAFLAVFRYETSPEQKLADYLREYESINRKEAENLLGLKQTAAGKVLKSMQEQNIITPIGNGKNTKYVLVQPKD